MHGAESLLEVVPPPSLRPFVWSLWIQHGASADAVQRQRIVPDGSLRLVVELGRPAILVGPHVGPVERAVHPGTTVVGARLRPGAGGILGVPHVGGLVDATLPAAQVTGSWAEDLARRLAEARSDRSALVVLARALEARRAASSPPDPLVAAAVRRLVLEPTSRIRALAEAASVSERHLRRRVQDATGLTPKALQRMLRFQVVLARVQRRLADGEPDAVELADVAARAGYVDQSHLSHETRRLTGVPPTRFLAETFRRCAHGHDHRAGFSPLGAAAS